MAEYIDRHDIAREVEFTESILEDRINLVIFTPKKQNYGSTYDMPLKAAIELRDNLNQLIGD